MSTETAAETTIAVESEADALRREVERLTRECAERTRERDEARAEVVDLRARRVSDEFWKSSVWGGIIPTPDQVRDELHDFHVCMKEVTKAYSEITGGRFSKPTTRAEWIIDAVEERIRQIDGEELLER